MPNYTKRLNESFEPFKQIDYDRFYADFKNFKEKYNVQNMCYTKIPREFFDEYNSLMLKMENSDISSESENNPVIFSYYYLNKRVRLHQAYIMKRFIAALKIGHLRIAMCLARQLGKTIDWVLLLIWLCWYNKFPVTISNVTICYIASRDDDTSVEFLEKLKLILYDGDKHMDKFTGDGTFFTGSIKEPNNSHQITLMNNCFIKSIPPTMKGVGKSASFFLIDEAHRLNSTEVDPDTFFDYSSAMVAETGGGIGLSSSPQGIIGFFYRAINPEQKEDYENDYESIWFPFFIWNDGTEKCRQYHEHVEKERIRLTSAGRLRYWQQEYLALFSVTETSFFEHTDIDDALKDTPQMYEYRDSYCSLGIDYGMKISRTVLTVRAVINSEIIQLFQYRCPADFDVNHLVNPDWEHSIQKLKQRYNLYMIVVDDSAPGDTINRWLEKNSGIQVKKYNFRSDQMSKKDGLNRNCAAYAYRARLKEGVLKIPKWNTVQQYEMKIIQETEQKVLISIKAPTGYLCDTFDSDMMACIPFLDMQQVIDYSFGSGEESEVKKCNMIDRAHPRYDKGIKQFTSKEIKEIISTGELWRLAA